MKYLIINADEYGLTEGVNNAIIDCVKAGVVTSTTVIVNGPGMHHAVQHLPVLSEKRVSVGLHFNLTLGSPVSEKVPNLVSPEGKFYPRKWLCMKLLYGQILRSEVMDELAAQWNRLAEVGITPSHLDGHEHVHILPGILEPVLAFAVERQIPVRLPCEKSIINRSMPLSLYPKVIKKQFAKFLARRACHKMDELGVWHPSEFLSIFSVLENPVPDLPTYETIFRHIPRGVSELMCHPALDDPELFRYSEIADRNFLESKFLLSPAFTDLITRYGVRLTSYFEAGDCTRFN